MQNTADTNVQDSLIFFAILRVGAFSNLTYLLQ